VAYGSGVRVAHVSDCFAPRVGGIETQVAALAREQRCAGDEVRIITATPGPPMDDVTRISVPLPADIPVHPRNKASIVRALTDQACDVLHVHMGAVSPFAWGAVRAGRQLGIPTLVTVHSMWGGISRRAYGLGARTLDRPNIHVAAVSNAAARAIARALPDVGPISITPNGIDPAPWRTSVEPPEDEPLHVVTVMRLAPRKRLGALLRIFRTVAEQRPGSHLTIIGDGPQRGAGERRARSMPVTFAGRLDLGGIRRIFETAHVYVQPSVHESFGIAALEARCAGLPVVARSGSGVDAFVHDGFEGFLVSSDDAMQSLLTSVEASELHRIRHHNMTTDPPVTWRDVLPMVRHAYCLAGAD
jgi:phosphatidylinositol alpha 1,6-mannosyltransferase